MSNLFDEPVTFKSWYMSYPRKMKPRDAEKAWHQAIERGATPQRIAACTKIMWETTWKHRVNEDREKGKPDPLQRVPYPASFLRGETWEQDPRESFEQDSDERTLAFEREQTRQHHHWCNRASCGLGHEWTCDRELCIWPGHYWCHKPASEEKPSLVSVK
jgi:hypothetical protein